MYLKMDFERACVQFLMALPFGKYKGLQLSQVPPDYLVWLSGFGRSLETLASNVFDCDCDDCNQFVVNSNSETQEEALNSIRDCLNHGIVPACLHSDEERIWWKVYMFHRDWIYKARDEFKLRGICRICLKHLVPIGQSRWNGAVHPDWEGRTTHKQCWKREKFGY